MQKEIRQIKEAVCLGHVSNLMENIQNTHIVLQVEHSKGFMTRVFQYNVTNWLFKRFSCYSNRQAKRTENFHSKNVQRKIRPIKPPAELELQTNFNAISKNIKNLKIGRVEQKLWKNRQTVGVKSEFTRKIGILLKHVCQ